MSINVNGKQYIQPDSKKVNYLNDVDHKVSHELTVYGSSPDWESLADGPDHIDAHSIYNLRIMKERRGKCIVKPS